jgi:anti-sigma factor ChrR (cupin superfamily)
MKHTGTEHESGPERAALYALGALSQHEARAFEEHLSDGCTSCAADLRDFERVVEGLAFGAPPAAPPTGARERLLARVSAGAKENTPAGSEGNPRGEVTDVSCSDAGEESPRADSKESPRLKVERSSLDETHAAAPPRTPGAPDFLIVRSGDGEWMRTPDAGVFVKVLFIDKDRDTVTTLVRMEPGASIPRHRHRGVEQCLVLEGDVHTGEHAMTAGDFNCSLSGSVHDRLTTGGGALLFLVSPESYELLEDHA